MDRLEIKARAYVEENDDVNLDWKKGRARIDVLYYCDNDCYAEIDVKNDGTVDEVVYAGKYDEDLPDDIKEVAMRKYQEGHDTIMGQGNPWKDVKTYLNNIGVNIIYGEEEEFENDLKVKQENQDHERYEQITHPFR